MFPLFVDLMTDDAADGCATDGPDRAATCQDGAADGTDAGADGSVFILRRHSGTSTQADQHDCSHCTERESVNCFYWVSFVC